MTEQINSALIEKARNANLAEYFQKGGYECELRRDELHVKGYGGLFVNVKTNEWYCFSQADKKGGKNAVNCLTDVIGIDFKTAVEQLADERFSYARSQNSPRISEQKNRELQLPERDNNMKKVFAYLCQTRKISSKLVSDLAHDGLLYQDKKGNAVFLHKNENGETIGAEIQGTNSEKRFKGVAAGTSDSVFSVKIGEPKKCYVFESAIDLLSFKQLANQEKIQNSVLVSMAGLKPNSLKPFAEKGLKIYSCVDNDEAGMKFNYENKLISCNKILSEQGVKDFNELLQKVVQSKEFEKRKAASQTPVSENFQKKISHKR